MLIYEYYLGCESMKAIILAAGEGNRLRPFTTSEPKVMIQLANKPMLEYVITALVENNVRDIIIVVGYKKERILSYFQNGKEFGAKIQYVNEKKQLGTAHALSMVKGKTLKKFIVLPGDNVIEAKTIKKILELNKVPCVLTTKSNTPSKYGEVLIKNGIIQKIVEKPEYNISNIISTGIYIFNKNIFSYIEAAMKVGEYGLSGVVQRMIDSGEEVYCHETGGSWNDAVYPWDLLDVNAVALKNIHNKISGKLERNVIINGNVKIESGSIIKAGCYLQGPITIGRGCEIGPYVTIFPATSIGENVQIRPYTTISHSILMNDSHVGPGSNISHTVLGEGVKIGSHFGANNDDAFIRLADKLYKISNIGTMIGEDTIIGDQVVTRPGTIVGSNSQVGSLNKLQEFLPNNSKVV